MSTEVVDVEEPIWEVTSTSLSSSSSSSKNHLTLSIESSKQESDVEITTAKTNLEQQQIEIPSNIILSLSPTSIEEINNIADENSSLSFENHNEINNENDETTLYLSNQQTISSHIDENSDNDEHNMTSHSPTTSLPPLPDLIPIRKSNISNHQSNTIIVNKRSTTPSSISTTTTINLSVSDNNCNAITTNIIDIIATNQKSSHNNNSNTSNDLIENKDCSTEDIAKEEFHQDQQQQRQILENSEAIIECQQQTQLEKSLEHSVEIEKQNQKNKEEKVEEVKDIDENIQINNSLHIYENMTPLSTKTVVKNQDNQLEDNLNDQEIPLPEKEQSKQLIPQKKRGRPKGSVNINNQPDHLTDDSKLIQHRKSDRRRVARDIFFLFEEHPANRRRNKRNNAKKRGRPPRNNTIKSSQPIQQPVTPVPLKKYTSTSVTQQELVSNESNSGDNLVPRVNPIFLWVKQDDTRIVEVRCEDYDKRNRIRLTKTPNGWRAIPRTDTSSSRVVKLLPNPLVRIKKELQSSRPNLIETTTKDNCRQQHQMDEFIKRMKKSKKKKKKKKKKRTHSTDSKEEKIVNERNVEDECEDDVCKLLSPSPKDVIVYESTNHEHDEIDEIREPTPPPPLPPTILSASPTLSHHQVDLINEPNNNETSDLTKNLSHISDDIDLDMPFMQHIPNDKEVCDSMMALCPQTGIFQHVAMQNSHENISSPNHDHVVLSDSFDPTDVCQDVDTKHLKELLDDADLLQHCDNTMSGAELIDSLVKRGCEDNHISEDDDHHNVENHNQHNSHPHDEQEHNNNNNSEHNPKSTMCLSSDDFDHEDDELLMHPEPVEDIISRLGESLAASPKCLSFNEAGEIERLHGELFPTTQNDPFNRTALEELSITIKDLEKSTDNFTESQSKMNCDENQRTLESTTTIVSPDSCADELPKDLTCKKISDNVPKQQQNQNIIERSHSRSSDAIQSPQPSGLPAVPPSPDIIHSKNKTMFLDQFLNNNSVSPKICSSVTVTPVKVIKSIQPQQQQQKEPLDLGKHRKSASPTVSCSEEVKRTQAATCLHGDQSNDEPLQKKIKTEPEIERKGQSESLIDLLSCGKDPDPLTQLQLLISNSEWKVPDPILVPKDRLSAVLASPAREIPLLLTTRPELRLPEAFAYPAILQDPDILVVSMAQLETILQKQMEITPPKVSPVPQITIETVNKNRSGKQTLPQSDLTAMKKAPNKSLINPLAPLLASGLANDIDTATLAAFNQMFWLPYIGQMAPELFKAMAGFPNNPNIAEIIPFLMQQQQQQHQHQQQQKQQVNTQFNANPMAFQNPLELAMWQEALNQAQMQRAFKMNANRDQNKKNSDTKLNTNTNTHLAALFTQKINNDARSHQQEQQQNNQNQQQMRNRSLIGINPFRQDNSRTHLRKSSNEKLNNLRSINAYHASQCGTEISPIRKAKHSPPLHIQNDQKPRVTCKSLSNLLQPERLMQTNDTKLSNLMAMSTLDFNHHQQQQQQQQFQNQQYSYFHSQQQMQNLHHTTQHQYSNNNHLTNPSVNHNHTATNNNNNNNSINNNNGNTVNNNNSGQSLQGKLKVKPGAHLLDPAAMQRRLLNCDDIPEVGSTTSGLDEMINDPNAPLWHPLFGSFSSQKTGYTSPWQWTTVTATGE